MKLSLLFAFPIALFAQATVVESPWDNIFNGSALAALIGVLTWIIFKEVPAMRKEAREERDRKEKEAREERSEILNDFKEIVSGIKVTTKENSEQISRAIEKLSDTVEVHNREHK